MMPHTTAQVPAGPELFIGTHEALSGDTQTSVSTESREIQIITVNVPTSAPTGW